MLRHTPKAIQSGAGDPPPNDEPGYAAFQQDPRMLETFLKEHLGQDGMRFLTYPKLAAGLTEIWNGYHHRLERTFGFAVQPGDRIMDIGAHHGIMSLNWARLGANVLAVEPNPINGTILERNITLNPGYHIMAVRKAAGETDGEATFNFGKTSTTGALLKCEREWKRTDQNCVVKMLSLTSLLNLSDVDHVKLLKIDCEGGEYDFLLSVPVEQLRRVAYLCLEVHPVRRYTPDMMERFLREAGYEIASKPGAHGCVDVCGKRSD